jgi:hypothetical protein
MTFKPRSFTSSLVCSNCKDTRLSGRPPGDHDDQASDYTEGSCVISLRGASLQEKRMSTTHPPGRKNGRTCAREVLRRWASRAPCVPARVSSPNGLGPVGLGLEFQTETLSVVHRPCLKLALHKSFIFWTIPVRTRSYPHAHSLDFIDDRGPVVHRFGAGFGRRGHLGLSYRLAALASFDPHWPNFGVEGSSPSALTNKIRHFLNFHPSCYRCGHCVGKSIAG